jgi:hypothetical protein
MEDPRRQFKIEYLKKVQDELPRMNRAEFLEAVSQKFGKDWAGVVENLALDDIARRMMTEQIKAQLHELGE